MDRYIVSLRVHVFCVDVFRVCDDHLGLRWCGSGLVSHVIRQAPSGNVRRDVIHGILL